MELDLFKKWFSDHRKEILDDFFTFLRFSSISADPAYAPQVKSCAQWLFDYLAKSGLKVEQWQTSHYPVLFATYPAGKDRPTLLIYHHYDVQPVDPLDLWKSSPFEPEIRSGIVYARGASDNKGQCFYSLCAIKAAIQLAKNLAFNLKVIIEGEEESGSEGLEEILQTKAEALKADYLIVVDGHIPSIDRPAITIGSRGIMTMEVACTNAKIDLHSGTHGGIALNPNRALVSALAKLWDDKGAVAIPHFYDEVKMPSKEELKHIDLSFDEKDYVNTFGVHAFANEPRYSPVESNQLRPSLEINGIAGGYGGEGFKTVIPAKAIAKLSCRLVPDQDPEKVFEHIREFLKSQMPKGVTFTARYFHGAQAFRSRSDSPAALIVKQAYEEVTKKTCRNIFIGASIPIIGKLTQASGAESLIMGYALDSDDIHAPNEHFGLDRFELGFLTMARILSFPKGVNANKA